MSALPSGLRLFNPGDETTKSMRIQDPHALCPKASWTLRKCCEAWIFPRLMEDQTATRRLFLGALTHWERATRDPGVGEVAELDALSFQHDLLKAGLKRATIRKNWGYLKQVLRTAKDKQFLDAVPKLAPMAASGRRVRIVPSPDLNAVYEACSAATWPEHPQISPPDFWRTALVLFVFYGPRCMDLFNALPWRGAVVETDWPAVGIYRDPRCPLASIERLGLRSKWGWLVYRPTKTKRIKPEPLVLPLNRVARLHLDRIAGEREFVLPMSRANHAFAEQWERLLTTAAIPRDHWFTRHDLRRTCETRYGDIGEHITGHAARTVSAKYYRQFAGEIVRAVREAKVPRAFTAIYPERKAEPKTLPGQLELF